MASSSILSKTLHSITDTKLAEIEKQRGAFEKSKLDLIVKLSEETDPLERVNILLNGIASIPSMEHGEDSKNSLENIKRFISQARRDPSVAQVQLKDWEGKLTRQLDVQSLRYEYASLYGQLVNEWLRESPGDKGSLPLGSAGDVRHTGTPENMGRKEKHDQRATWEEYVFKPLKVDSEALRLYLDDTFGSREIKKAMSTLRDATCKHEEAMQNKITETELGWCIAGMLRSDLLTDEKRTVLMDFQSNNVVLSEICDVLNMRLASMDTWSWGTEGIPVDQRRQLNGRYRFYQDEDLLQSIFLRYIGVKWSVHFKQALKKFYTTVNPTSAYGTAKMTADQTIRYEWFIDSLSLSNLGLAWHHEDFYRDKIFLEQLQDQDSEVGRSYDDVSQSDDGFEKESPQQLTQDVIHHLASEVVIRTRLGEDISVVRSDFKWFGPSLPHDTMFTVLRFFGMSEKWVDFFKRAIEAPMQFIEDGPDAQIRIRKRGTPISGPLSNMLGETVLFCLDVAFKQKTFGATTLYRLHDDAWFWGSREACENGWAVMEEFARLTGLEFQKDKTGSVEVCGSAGPSNTSSKLPIGPVRFGFLKLSPAGRFVIDQSSVLEHIAELKLQLDACKSVFDWIQAWNVYATRFFTTNFGQPCNVFGPEHVEEILSAFQMIQHSLFGPNSSVSSEVKTMLTERFGVTNIPEGYLYFGIDVGGLDLKSPFVGPYLIREQIVDPKKIMEKFFDDEETSYRVKKNVFERCNIIQHDRCEKPKNNPDEFMSFEEYKSYRWTMSADLEKAFKALIKQPDACHVKAPKEIEVALSSLSLTNAEHYKRWIMVLYGNEMIERFGDLTVVDKGLLPTGMVGMFRQSRFKWQN